MSHGHEPESEPTPEPPRRRESNPDPPARTRTGEILREARRTGGWFAELSPVQVQTFALMIMTSFVCGLGGWVLYQWQRSVTDDKAMSLRWTESESEKSRTFFAAEARETRIFYASEREKDRAHDSDENAKLRTAITSMAAEWIKFREAMVPLLKKLAAPEEIEIEIPAAMPLRVAPVPRAKATGQ